MMVHVEPTTLLMKVMGRLVVRAAQAVVVDDLLDIRLLDSVHGLPDLIVVHHDDAQPALVDEAHAGDHAFQLVRSPPG